MRLITKISGVLMLCLLPICANATDMCARDDTMVLVFDKDIGGSGSGSNATEWTWWVNFAYGRIAGDATCLSAAEGLGRTSGQGAYYGTGDYSKTFIEAESGLKGTDSDGNDRKYCWCKMTHPVSSRWVFTRATLIPPRVHRIARTTAVTTSTTTPRCAGACLGRSASDVPANIEYV